MENITIKSVTNCPTCGSECKVEGGTTHHYVPIKKYTEEDILELFKKFDMDLPFNYEFLLKEHINSINKQD